MMLLDTHIFLWWLFDDTRLPANIKEYIQDIDNLIYVSAVSVWEISTKYQLINIIKKGGRHERYKIP
jgi:PIN domain nuclease of toxin-antitoxin system